MLIIKMNTSSLNKAKRLLFSLNKSNHFATKATSNLAWPADKVRSTFIDYFCEKNKHKFIRSSTVLPKKGSGTYFTNAGMNQFKSMILGEIEAKQIVDFDKYIGIANTQKCIRIGGKHNDLEDIGKDTYHHTFFEMLGNWSFGSYENEKACQMALDLLVNQYKLNINGLYFTYFGGDKTLGLESDTVTKNIWIKLGVPERQILPFGMKENFWEMDVVGPCGPCTEIHYDRNIKNQSINAKNACELVNAGTERVIELWNIVFMNYNRINKTNFSKLQKCVIDTGMGLERLTAVLNNLESNYDTDLFTPLFSTIYEHSKQSGIKQYEDYKLNDPISIAYRTLADYMRSITISINDGLMPSRNGLGGFLKFLILNSMKTAKETFKVQNESQLLCELSERVVDSLHAAFPELKTRKLYIQQVIKNTDEKQKQKLTSSEEKTQRFMKKLNNPTSLSGEQIWRLYKGDGSGEEISIEFIRNFFLTKNVQLDLDGFNKIYLEDNEKALRNMKNTRTDYTKFIELAGLVKDVAKTDDWFKYEFNLDTSTNESTHNLNGLTSKILAIAVKNKENDKYELVKQLKSLDECILILDKTNFYSESGGQQSDNGLLKCKPHNALIAIDKCIKIQGFTFHIGKVTHLPNEQTISLDDQVECVINSKLRYNLTLNHTGVHIINHAIRQCYNSEDSIIQVASSVKNDSFKFEFKFNKIFDKPELRNIKAIENICKNIIKKSLPIYTANDVVLDDLSSTNYPLRKLYDVLYPNKVRVVTIGAEWKHFTSSKESEIREDISAELCCGTHAVNTSQLENLAITHFNVVGDSSYEIEATTGVNVRDIVDNDKKVLDYFNQMIELASSAKNTREKMDTYERLKHMNELSHLSIKIESIFKEKTLSYTTLKEIKNETQKYRPSKNAHENVLKKYFQEELGENSKLAVNAAVIASIDPNSTLSIKFLAFDSILNSDEILDILRNLKHVLHPALIVYNNYRGNYIFYSRNKIDENKELKDYFDSAQLKILEKSSGTRLSKETENSRVIICRSTLDGLHVEKNYFNF